MDRETIKFVREAVQSDRAIMRAACADAGADPDKGTPTLDAILALCDFAEHHTEPKCPSCGTTDGVIRPGKVCLNPWHAIEPKGCPTPGACSCPGYQEAADPNMDGNMDASIHVSGDMVETISPHIPMFCRKPQQAKTAAEAILTALKGRILQPGEVAVPASCPDGHAWKFATVTIDKCERCGMQRDVTR